MKYTLNQNYGETKTTYEPYEGNSYRVDFGGKNILELKNTTREINGVTFTPQTDGSVLVNGTASANATYPINVNSTSNNFTVPIQANTTYTISKSSNENVDNILFQIYWYKNGTVTYSTGTFTTTNAGNLGAYIRVTSGTTINNKKIYLQIEKRKCSNSIQSIYS